MNTRRFFLRAGPPLPLRLAVAAVACALAGSALAQAAPAEREDLEQLRATTLALIQALVEQGLLSRERADALLRQAARAAMPAAAAAAGTPPVASAATPPSTAAAKPGAVVRVPYVPETVRAQIKEEIRNEVLETAREERWADARQLPAWVRSITIEGDVRVRGQGEGFGSDNVPAEVFRSQVDSPAWSPDLVNTQTSRTRMTLRARLGLTAKVSDDVVAGIRVSTTNTSPATESATLGNYGNRLTIGFDRAYVRWEPRYDLRFEAGRMAVPFYGTDLLWPEDLSLDGFSVRAERDFASGLYGFAIAGAFPLEEFALTRGDKWLYGIQVGADWAVTAKTSLRFAAGLYDFHNIEGVRETEPPPTGPRAGTVPYQSSQYPSGVRQRGNTLINLNDPTSTAAPVWGLASRFRPFNLTAGVTFSQFEPITIGITADYVKNSAFDLADIRRRAGTDAVNDLVNKTTGVQLRAQVGSLRLTERGNWQAFFALRKFERDSWLDAFTDTTWHLGGTSYKGFSLGGGYAIDRSTWLGLRYTSTRNLDDGQRFFSVPGDPTSISGNLSSAPQKVDVIQVEVNTRF